MILNDAIVTSKVVITDLKSGARGIEYTAISKEKLLAKRYFKS